MGLAKSDIEQMKANKDVRGLIKALKEGNRDVPGKAAWALADIASPAVEGLTRALKNKSSEVRDSAAWALERINGSKSLDHK
jgi:HEAT repeat protein